MRERDIVNKILKYLNGLHACKAIKIHGDGYTEAGTPDILGCYRSKMFAIEVKVPGKEPTSLQYQRLYQWRDAGAEHMWVDNLEKVKERFV